MDGVPTAVLAGGALAPGVGAGTLAADVGAALGAVDAGVVLQAVMIAGMDTRPAAPAMPLRTVRRETGSTRMGSTMVFTPPPMLPDKIRQDQPDCPYQHPSCQGPRGVNVRHLFECVDFLCVARQSLMAMHPRG